MYRFSPAACCFWGGINVETTQTEPPFCTEIQRFGSCVKERGNIVCRGVDVPQRLRGSERAFCKYLTRPDVKPSGAARPVGYKKQPLFLSKGIVPHGGLCGRKSRQMERIGQTDFGAQAAPAVGFAVIEGTADFGGVHIIAAGKIHPTTVVAAGKMRRVTGVFIKSILQRPAGARTQRTHHLGHHTRRQVFVFGIVEAQRGEVERVARRIWAEFGVSRVDAFSQPDELRSGRLRRHFSSPAALFQLAFCLRFPGGVGSAVPVNEIPKMRSRLIVSAQRFFHHSQLKQRLRIHPGLRRCRHLEVIIAGGFVGMGALSQACIFVPQTNVIGIQTQGTGIVVHGCIYILIFQCFIAGFFPSLESLCLSFCQSSRQKGATKGAANQKMGHILKVSGALTLWMKYCSVTSGPPLRCVATLNGEVLMS